MSQIVSPKTGRLIKVGGKAFRDLLEDPQYRDTLLVPETVSKSSPYVSPVPSLSINAKVTLSLPPLSPIYSPSASLSKVPMTTLPPLSPRSPRSLPPLSPRSPSSLPPLPPRSPRSLPPLSPRSLPPLSPRSLPPLKVPVSSEIKESRVEIPIHEVYPEMTSDEHLSEILAMPFYDIPTLEETLKHTKQPARRAKIAEMIKTKKYEERRGIKTRGWSARAPTRGRERHQLKAECGDKCFLLPEKEKFPICASPRMTGGKSKCAIDCQGVQSALVRARQWGYSEVASKAEAILEKCNAEGMERFVPSPRASKKQTEPKIPSSMLLGGKMDSEDYGVVRRNARRSVWFEDEGHHDHKIRLSPSLTRYGSHKKSSQSQSPDCGCGK